MSRRARRELGVACLLTLAGALVVALATRQQSAPAARALALVALAGVVALLAARGWTRFLVGILLALSGIAIIAMATVRLIADTALGWPAAALAGGLLVLASGALTAARGRSWLALGARYEAPEMHRPASDGDVWAALDRGEDPTQSGHGIHS